MSDNDTAELFIDCRCELAEGPLWHPGRQQLFWFDILEGTLHAADTSGTAQGEWAFGEPAAAAGIVDDRTLAVATASALVRLDLDTGERTHIADHESDVPGNRCNDSRVNPAGGFWLGTMSRKGDSEPGVGAVYQYREGAMEKLFDGITIPNSICFSPKGNLAYFADTPTNLILKCAINPRTGKPTGNWTTFFDTSQHRGHPDGAVVDSEGYLWSARWGGSCVVRHAPDGSISRVVELPVPNVTCPALGGPDLKTLYITTAREHMSAEDLERYPLSGSIFAIEVEVPGLPESVLRI